MLESSATTRASPRSPSARSRSPSTGARRDGRRAAARSPTAWRRAFTRPRKQTRSSRSELVRSLLDSGSIARRLGRAGPLRREGLSSDVLPATIQQAVAKRIERLPEERARRPLDRLGPRQDLRVPRPRDAGGAERRPRRRHRAAHPRRADRGGAGVARRPPDVFRAASSATSSTELSRRRRRRSLHRKYAELLEQRYEGRVERIYPQLVHHYSEGDVAEKTVEYGLKLGEKVTLGFSSEEVARVARTVLDYVEGADWAGAEAPEGEARLLLARASQIGRTPRRGPARGRGRRVKVFERRTGPDARWPTCSSRRTPLAGAAAWTRRAAGRSAASRRRGRMATSTRWSDFSRRRDRGEHARAQEGARHTRGNRATGAEEREAEEAAEGGTLVVAPGDPGGVGRSAAARTIEEQEVCPTRSRRRHRPTPRATSCRSSARGGTLLADGEDRLARPAARCPLSDGSAVTASGREGVLRVCHEAAPGRAPRRFAVIRGAHGVLAGTAEGVERHRGVVPTRRSSHPPRRGAPIFPALLTELAAAVSRSGEAGAASGPPPGHGALPDRVARAGARRPGEEPAHVEAAPAAAGRHRVPRLDERVGDYRGPSRRARRARPRPPAARPRRAAATSRASAAGLIETPKKGTYFVLFNCGGGSQLGSNPALRRALAGVTRSQDFVWGALGRFALPATGLLPPGILGHDAGRRRALLPREAAGHSPARGGARLSGPPEGLGPPHPSGQIPSPHVGALRRVA